ncbi:MAG TPA: hypothetical protein VMV08_07350, partial [Gaiellaceae bacterium]|nr:hypothetical protein [Gaiellaceae bacterium]
MPIDSPTDFIWVPRVRSAPGNFSNAKRGLEGELEWAPHNLHPWFAAELEGIEREEAAQRSTQPVFRRI